MNTRLLGAVAKTLSPDFPATVRLPPVWLGPFDHRRFGIWGHGSHGRLGTREILLVGRVFNPAQLAVTLEVGDSTETPGEAALLLHAYQRWGRDFPKHLEGEYAFVLWDQAAGWLLLGRDSTGNQPLFYIQHGEDLIFASEVRSLLSWPGIALRPNEERIAQWLALVPDHTTSTFFEGIFSVQRGSTLLYQEGRITHHIFWQPENAPPLRLRDSREYSEGLVQVLETAIGDRLRTYPAIGSQLSGGLDSPTVTALTANLLNQSNRRLYSFTAVPQHPMQIAGYFCDEGPHAASVAAMYPNIDHVLVPHGSHPYFGLIDRFSSTQMQPIFNVPNYDWLYEICLQAASRDLNTLLVGSSGNFSFSYNGNHALQSLFKEFRLLTLAGLAWDMHRQNGRRWRNMAYEVLRPWMPTRIRQALDRRQNRAIEKHENSMIRREFAERYALGGIAAEEALTLMDSRSLRLAFLLRRDPGLSISAFRELTGVGTTDPAGDRRVIEYCLSVPIEYYCENGIPRSLIRNAMIGRLPEQVRTERRKGLQAADYSILFRVEQQEALAELARMKKVDLAVQALDLNKMETMLQGTKQQGAEHEAQSSHWPVMMRALSLGRFLRRMEDGTLLSLPESESNRTLSKH